MCMGGTCIWCTKKSKMEIMIQNYNKVVYTWNINMYNQRSKYNFEFYPIEYMHVRVLHVAWYLTWYTLYIIGRRNNVKLKWKLMNGHYIKEWKLFKKMNIIILCQWNRLQHVQNFLGGYGRVKGERMDN